MSEKQWLIVEVRARFDYLYPPQDMQESVRREQERHRIAAIAKHLEPTVQASMQGILDEVAQP